MMLFTPTHQQLSSLAWAKSKDALKPIFEPLEQSGPLFAKKSLVRTFALTTSTITYFVFLPFLPKSALLLLLGMSAQARMLNSCRVARVLRIFLINQFNLIKSNPSV